MARVAKLKSKETKKIMRKCRLYLRQVAAINTLVREDPAAAYVFDEDSGRYRLAYVASADAWVLEVVRAAPAKGRKNGKPSAAKGAGAPRKKAQSPAKPGAGAKQEPRKLNTPTEPPDNA